MQIYYCCSFTLKGVGSSLKRGCSFCFWMQEYQCEWKRWRVTVDLATPEGRQKQAACYIQAGFEALVDKAHSEREERFPFHLSKRRERGCSRESNNHYSTPSKHHPLNKAPNNNMHFSVLLGCLTLQQSEPALCSQTRKLATKQSLNTPHSLPLADRKGAHASLPVLERRKGGEAERLCFRKGRPKLKPPVWGQLNTRNINSIHHHLSPCCFLLSVYFSSPFLAQLSAEAEITAQWTSRLLSMITRPDDLLSVDLARLELRDENPVSSSVVQLERLGSDL